MKILKGKTICLGGEYCQTLDGYHELVWNFSTETSINYDVLHCSRVFEVMAKDLYRDFYRNSSTCRKMEAFTCRINLSGNHPLSMNLGFSVVPCFMITEISRLWILELGHLKFPSFFFFDSQCWDMETI